MNPVVDPLLKLAVVAGQKVNNQWPSQKLKKGETHMTEALEDLENHRHLLPLDEARKLFEKHEM